MTDQEPEPVLDKDGNEIEFPEPAPDPEVEVTHKGPEGEDEGEE